MQRKITDAMPPTVFAYGGLIGIDEGLAWRIAPLTERAQRLADRGGWPDWRRDELIQTLVRQFTVYTDAGMSFDDALARLDVILATKSGENP
ncbi:hypothetical protein [Cupriavidus sp. TMH.W2]|uniref:hypothetical protein n=1 Tax=Cupriavidus sp. TMH.W2 TaxID=3434465 RepID=UPI003D779D51